MKNVFWRIIPLVTIIFLLINCRNKNSQNISNIESQEKDTKHTSEDYCYSNLTVKAFDYTWKTICPSVEIKVNSIYYDGQKNIIVIEREQREYQYTEGDSISLSSFNQEQSMAYVKKIYTDSATLKVKCNCDK